jgi:hypothetical protein
MKVTLLLFLVAGYLVLSYPFMQLRIPPTGVGVPLGELALITMLLTLNMPRVLSRMGTIVALVPFLFWWGWGFARLIIDATREGPWALRDGTQLIESLFIVAGFSLIAGAEEVSRLSRWFRGIIVACCLYGLSFIFGNALIAISPTLPGGSEQPIPILGTYATTGTMLLLGAFLCMIQSGDAKRSRLRSTLIAGFLVSYAVLVIQARTTYVQLLSLGVFILLVRPTALRGLGSTIPVFCALLAIVTAFEIRISGRLSSEISWSFLWDHVQSIFGIGSHGSVGEAAGGVSLRFGWWLQLYDELTSDPAVLFSGLGFGVPLTDFRDTAGVLAREPHNSIISVAARLGIVVGLCWIWMQVELFRAAYRTYRTCRRMGWQEEAQLILLIMAFALLTLASCLGEDTMEKPYNAIPYYALWGVVVRIAYNVRRALPESQPYANTMPAATRLS